MGPGTDKLTQRGIADPPMFSPNKDQYIWRKDIANWVDLIKVGAEEGEDKLYKTIFKTLGRQLYSRGLPQAQKSIVDHAQEIGKIDYKQSDQVAAVQDIVDLIAVDPPIVVVSRLIESFNRVSNCRRKKNESLSSFVSRFSGLASEHLMHADASPNSKIGEVLAITLITNANLGETTHQSAKIQLISAAKARMPEESNSDPPLAKCNLIGSDCANLREVNTKLVTTIDQLDAAINVSGAEDTVSNAKHALEEAKTSLEVIQPLQMALCDKVIVPPSASQAASTTITVKAKRLPIYLDDAISVIRSLEQGISPAEGSISAIDVEAIVKRTLMAAQQKGPSSSDARANEQSFNKQLKTLFGQSRKGIEKDLQISKDLSVPRRPIAKRFCKDCAEKGHYKGDLRCKSPSLHTQKMREKNRKRQEKRDEAQKGEELKNGRFFRRGSRPNEA